MEKRRHKNDEEEETEKKEKENIPTLIIDDAIPAETVFGESWPTTTSVWLRI